MQVIEKITAKTPRREGDPTHRAAAQARPPKAGRARSALSLGAPANRPKKAIHGGAQTVGLHSLAEAGLSPAFLGVFLGALGALVVNLFLFGCGPTTL